MIPSFHPFKEDHLAASQIATSLTKQVISSCQCCLTDHTPGQATIHLEQLNPNQLVININDGVNTLY